MKAENKAMHILVFSIHSLCSFSSSKVATSHGDHTIKVFEVKTGKCVASLKGHSRTAWTLCYHPYHDNIIASGSLDGEIKVWDLLVSCVRSSTYIW